MSIFGEATDNSSASLDRLLDTARCCAQAYLNDVRERAVFPQAEAIEALAVFDEDLPDAPANAEAILKALHDFGSPATVAQSGGRYFGFVNGGMLPAALAAKWLADVWDQNAALYVMSPIVSKLESVCQHWLCELLRLPPQTVAGFVSGTSAATACGLAAGRNALLKRTGWDVDEQGLFEAPPIRVVVGEQAHASVFKALALLGLGKKRVEFCPVDEQGRMIADKLPRLDDRTLLIVQAGNVNSGAFDPLADLCDRANSAGAWVHVDGAFGLWAAASASTRHLTAGMEKADSWSVDAHKTLNAPYDCGIVLCRHRDALVSALQSTGAYIQYSEHRDGMLYTPEMSRRARAVELWAALKSLGREGADRLIQQLCQRAQLFARSLAERGFEILNEVVFNQVLVACDSDKLTREMIAYIQQSGECWVGGAEWFGRPVIRISVCSWVTSEEDVSRSVDVFVKARSIFCESHYS